MAQPLRQPPHRQVWLLILAVVVVAGVAVAWQLWPRSAGPAPNAAALTTTTAASVAVATGPPAALQPPSGVLWQQTGSDIELGDAFDAPRNWRIVWSFDCQNFAKFGGGNFKLTGDGDFEHVTIQQFAVRASGTKRITGGGHGRLVIDSVCQRWTVKAIAP